CRTNGNLNVRAVARFAFAGLLRGERFDDAQQFDRITELFGKLDVQSGDVSYAFDINVFGVNPKSVRQRSEDSNFVQRIMAIDIQRWLCLGVTLRLGILKNRFEITAFEFHARKDVIACAIDDPVKVGNAVANKT